MSTVRPFRALRPARDLAAKVASPPYDVVNSKEARAFRAGNDASFFRVSRPEVDLDVGVDEHADEVYAQGKKALDAFVADGTLVPDAEARLYLYAQTQAAGHRQVGVVGCASVDEYDRDVIKKHEKTRPDKEDDRTRHIDELAAHDEPVFLTYRAHAGIDAIVARETAKAPAEDFTTSDGVRHQVWVLTPETSTELARLFDREVPALYVADGHHRSAAASRVHASRKDQPGEHDAFLSVVFPHDQMQILAYNRVIKDDRGRSPAEILKAIGERFDLSPALEGAPPEPRSFCVFCGGSWHLARTRAGTFDASDPVASLDCSIAQDQILDAVFGITDPRRDSRVDFVGGIRGAAELERRVREDGFSLALHLFPTPIDALLQVSDASRLMPPKSTWFEPKLRSGLFVHRFFEGGR